jgi:hypothetical protein
LEIVLSVERSHPVATGALRVGLDRGPGAVVHVSQSSATLAGVHAPTARSIECTDR